MSCSSVNPHSISVCVIHSHHNGNMYLLLHRSKTCAYLQDTWQWVTGGVKSGEKAYEAAVRAMREEAGLAPDRLYCADAVETFYMQTTDKVMLVPVFVAFIDKMQADVQLTLNRNDDYEWMAFDVAQDRLVFAEQKRILSHIRMNFILNDPNPIHQIAFR